MCRVVSSKSTNQSKFSVWLDRSHMMCMKVNFIHEINRFFWWVSSTSICPDPLKDDTPTSQIEQRYAQCTVCLIHLEECNCTFRMALSSCSFHRRISILVSICSGNFESWFDACNHVRSFGRVNNTSYDAYFRFPSTRRSSLFYWLLQTHLCRIFLQFVFSTFNYFYSCHINIVIISYRSYAVLFAS